MAVAQSHLKTEKKSANFHRLERAIVRKTGQAIADFGMIEQGDVILVCLSGGKDSYTMLDVLRLLQARAPIDFSLIAMNLDQKQPGFPAHILPEYLSSIHQQYHIVNEDTYSIVSDKIPQGKTMCSLCSRLRRGIIYRVADELKATKIALGHHLDDIIETFFLNLFYGGSLKSMPPRLRSDDGRHTVIRPLAYCTEAEIQRYANHREYPIIPCNLCGSQDGLKRQEIKDMIARWSHNDPNRRQTIFKALQNVVPSHLADTDLFDFLGDTTPEQPSEP